MLVVVLVVMVGGRVEVVIVSLDWIGLDRIVLMWTRERRSGDPVGLIIRSIVRCDEFFSLLLYLRTRGCLLGMNKSDYSEVVYVMYFASGPNVCSTEGLFACCRSKMTVELVSLGSRCDDADGGCGGDSCIVVD